MVNGNHISSELPHITGIKFLHLDFNDHIAMKFDIVEQHVNEVVCVSNFKLILTPNKGKAVTKLKKKSGNVIHKSIFQFFFVIALPEGKKIEGVRVSGNSLSKIALRSRKSKIKIAYCFALSFIEVCIQKVHQYSSRPFVFKSFSYVK